MTATNHEEEGDERGLAALLPWAAAGRLSAADAARVAEHLRQDAGLAAQMRLVEEEREAVQALNETLPAPAPDAFARILAKIDALPTATAQSAGLSPSETQPQAHSPRRRLTAAAGTALARFEAWLEGFMPFPRAIAAMAAVLVIAAQAAVIGALMSGNPATYESATARDATAAGAMEVLIAFRPGTTIEEIGALLDARQAKVIDGPRAGFYRVRLAKPEAAGGQEPSTLESVLRGLKQSPVVAAVLPGG